MSAPKSPTHNLTDAGDNNEAEYSALKQTNAELKAVLNEIEKEDVEDDFKKTTGITRKQLIYGVLSVLAFYLAVGHNAALVCFLIGFVYPAYSTLKMFLSDRKKEDEQQWYTYWIIFSVCTMLDVYGDEIWHIFPFYYVIKSGIYASLYLPQTRGAHFVYRNIMKWRSSSSSSKAK